MFNGEDVFSYTLTDRDHYDSLNRHRPSRADFFDPVARSLGPAWSLDPFRMWFRATPEDGSIPVQGWKIHLSTTIARSTELLMTAVDVLRSARAPFKFAADRMMLSLLNSKRWARGAAGKFVTIYPRDTAHFLMLLDDLARELADFDGPYILSDRRYKDNRVIYYRYGGGQGLQQLTATGARKNVIVTPDGGFFEDRRLPYYAPPDWVEDPISGAKGSSGSGAASLADGRYSIRKALAFSTGGGVYEAYDRLGDRTVIVKEARPHMSYSSAGEDAIALLRKEHRLLTRLMGQGIAPEPIDLFSEWEHLFLVEEFLPGTILRLHAATFLPLALQIAPTREDVAYFLAQYRSLYSQIALGLESLHKLNIVFGDISHYNVIVSPEGTPKFIDFEGAYEIGVDTPMRIGTPGFTPDMATQKTVATFEDDYFGLGGLLLAGLMPINAMIGVDKSAAERFALALVDDLGLPREIYDAISGCSRPANERLRPSDVRDLLSRAETIRQPVRQATFDQRAVAQDIEAIQAYIVATATPERQDRLFPSDPRMFTTNPLNIAYGAAGVVYVLQRLGVDVGPYRDWICRQRVEPKEYCPGLYSGLAGLSWVLLELGMTDAAETVLCQAEAHPLAFDLADLFNGAAGLGLAELRFFMVSGNGERLAAARRAADFLIRGSKRDERGWHWPGVSGHVYAGLAHGSAGVALFLLYMYFATGEEEYLRAGQSALEFALSTRVETPGEGWSWHCYEGHNTRVPYWQYGSAGIGSVLVRYYSATQHDRYLEAARAIVGDCRRKYAIFPARFFGLAGLGEFLLDMAQFGVDVDSSLEGAREVAAGIALFGVKRPQGLAFPGEELQRLSCDYGTGSAGIALFLHRLLHGGDAPFLLDELSCSSHVAPMAPVSREFELARRVRK